MTVDITHEFVSPVADDPVAEAAGEVTPTRWNNGHQIVQDQGLLGKLDSGTGPTVVNAAAAIRSFLNVADGATAYTDEQAQDAVGAILSADFVYDDDGPGIGLQHVTLPEISEPSTPDADKQVVFLDENDGRIKSKDENDSVMTFAYTDEIPSEYTDSQAQTAVESILTNSDTIAWNIDPNVAIVADVRYQFSITSDSDGLLLVGDVETPGNSKYYGTDENGDRGFFDLPEGGGGGEVDPALIFVEQADDPDTPDSDKAALFVRADGLFYGIDDAGEVTRLSNRSASGDDGDTLSFEAGSGIVGTGGEIIFLAGVGADQGGDVHLLAGNGGSGQGGLVESRGGDGAEGGSVSFNAGIGSVDAGGAVSMQAGLGETDGGFVEIAAGDGTTGNGGSISLNGGDGAVDGGDVSVSLPSAGSGRQGLFIISGLPTVDPEVEGAFYIDGDTIKISSG